MKSTEGKWRVSRVARGSGIVVLVVAVWALVSGWSRGLLILLVVRSWVVEEEVLRAVDD